MAAQPGPAALTVTQLLIAAAAIETRITKGPTPAPAGTKPALDAIQRAIDTHPDAKRGDDQ